MWSGCAADLVLESHFYFDWSLNRILLLFGGPCSQLVVPRLVTSEGLLLAASVSHLQYVAAGVPIHFCASCLRAAVPERCCTHTYPGLVFLLISSLKLFVHGF